jgi:hypothetical protein
MKAEAWTINLFSAVIYSRLNKASVFYKTTVNVIDCKKRTSFLDNGIFHSYINNKLECLSLPLT